MSVMITGMEMPTSCFACPFRRKVDPDNIMCIVTREVFEETFAGTIETRNRGNCPLLPVPTHGRLIDADALEHDIRKDAEDAWNKEASPINWADAFYELADMVADAPTIIPHNKDINVLGKEDGDGA